VAGTLVLAVAIGTALAGEPGAPGKAANMEAMKAEFMKCVVCKNMAPHLEKLAPVMSAEVVKLNDGFAIVYGVSDKTLVPLFQSTCDLMSKAGEASMGLTDAQAKTDLCSQCQEIRSIMKAGAKMHSGKTASGEIMAFTSDDPQILTKLAQAEQKSREMCAMMAG
jgi:hypothetical protein